MAAMPYDTLEEVIRLPNHGSLKECGIILKL
jgi:cystathionine beta-lyase family protein involved in aluminum resistance